MAEHKVAEETEPRVGKYMLWSLVLRCTCGRRFPGTARTKERALEKAEAAFREHIPIR